jgi:hypothetical protein
MICFMFKMLDHLVIKQFTSMRDFLGVFHEESD